MDAKDPSLPNLRRETVLPPGIPIPWRRLPDRGPLAGVCAGLAQRFGMRPWKVRLAFVLSTLLLAGLAAVVYLLAAAYIPAGKRPSARARRTP